MPEGLQSLLHNNPLGMRGVKMRGYLDAGRSTESTTQQSLYVLLLTAPPYSKRQDVQTHPINATSHSAFGDNALPTFIMPHGSYRSDARRRAPTPHGSPPSRP